MTFLFYGAIGMKNQVYLQKLSWEAPFKLLTHASAAA